jgi:hypothetical protein
MLNAKPIGVTSIEYLTELVYELLDAHQDTTRLAGAVAPEGRWEGAPDVRGELASDVRWDAHLDYLRHLQRVGREALARVAG